MIGIFAFYLGCNFVVIVIPAVAYAAWLGDAVSRGLLALALVDYAVPLRPGRPWVAWCELTRVAEGIRSYFDAECVIEGDFRRDRSHLIVSHPHGLFGAGYGLYAHELRERFGMKPLFTGADVVFMLPLLRRIMVWWGMTMVSAAPLRRALSQPWPYNAVQLQPGGIAEMFYGTDCEQIILSKRKGLCRVALQTGASLVPSYVFGANEIYTRWFGPHSLAARLSSVLRTSLVGWSGRWGVPFSPLPVRGKLVIVLGAPIEVPRTESPTDDEVDALHARCVWREAAGGGARNAAPAPACVWVRRCARNCLALPSPHHCVCARVEKLSSTSP